MSFNRFDRFSHLDPESRLNQFRKRFDHLSQNANQMFSDQNLTNRWPNGMSSMSNPIPSERKDVDEEGVPIKVVHEKSDLKTDGETNEKNSDSMSSFGSSQSHRSSDTSHSGGSAAHSSRSHHSSDSGSSQPRVHHIPITVEPRDGSASSSYTSEPNVAAEQPLSRSSSHSSAHSVGSSGRTVTTTTSPAPASGVSSEGYNDPKGRVRQIPIKVESNDVQRSASPSNEKSPKQKKTSTPPKPKSKSGPFVTRIPVINQTQSQSPNAETIAKSDDNNGEKSVQKMDPMQEIEKILSDLKNYENEVNQFKGTVEDKQYRYLDEMLTRCMIKLDTIETNGAEDLRKARKAAVLAVNQCIGLLETKVLEAKGNKSKDQPMPESEQPMDVSTVEPTSQRNSNEEPMNTNENGSQNTEQNAKEVKEEKNCPQNQSTTETTNGRKETAV